jgi:RNA polymerase sigma-70 factor (ECF subfamily)
LNNLRDFGRRYRGTGRRELDREVSLDALETIGGSGPWFSSDSASPSENAIQHEKADIVHRALLRLPEDHRQVLLLRYQEGKSFEEIGSLMNRSANAARKLWLRAIERVERELEQVP